MVFFGLKIPMLSLELIVNAEGESMRDENVYCSFDLLFNFVIFDWIAELMPESVSGTPSKLISFTFKMIPGAISLKELYIYSFWLILITQNHANDLVF